MSNVPPILVISARVTIAAIILLSRSSTQGHSECMIGYLQNPEAHQENEEDSFFLCHVQVGDHVCRKQRKSEIGNDVEY